MEADVKRAVEGLGNAVGWAVGSVLSASVDLRNFLFSMMPFGSIFMRRFLIWFPLCSLGCSLIMQTQVVVDYSRVTVDDDDESEWTNDDDGSQSIMTPHTTRETVSPPGVITN
uniref:Dof zinc finger protein DOF3.3 n=1 Tax=Lygus hesperus TaxID=30085 RepID=A0A0A9XL45_LYGHE